MLYDYMNSENAISHIHVNKRSLGLVTTILALLQNTQVMRRPRTRVGTTHTQNSPTATVLNKDISTFFIIDLIF